MARGRFGAGPAVLPAESYFFSDAFALVSVDTVAAVPTLPPVVPLASAFLSPFFAFASAFTSAFADGVAGVAGVALTSFAGAAGVAGVAFDGSDFAGALPCACAPS